MHASMNLSEIVRCKRFLHNGVIWITAAFRVKTYIKKILTVVWFIFMLNINANAMF